MKNYLIKDIHGKQIKENELFEFDFLKEPNEKIRLKGRLVFSDEDLAYEIDVIDDEYYTCLTFVNCVNLISNIKTNK